MKKIVLASIVILSAFFTSCTKSNLVVEPDGANTLRAVMENSDGGRTTLDDGRNVIWSAGDKLSVFNQADQKQQAEYTLIQGEGTTSAVFQSNKSLGAGVKYAFYPASAEVACASDVISFNLPATQAYAKASFANGSNPMVAKSNTQGELLFQNLCGVIKFQLTGTATVASVKMETAGEVVAGAMTVKMDYTGAPAMEVAKTGTTSTSITLTDCNVSLSESVNSTFYFTVPAGTYAADLRFTAYNSAGEVIRTKATSASLTVLRSHIASLPGASEKLYFPDPIFRAKLVEKYQFVQTADGTDIDITNPVNAGKLKDKTLDVSYTVKAASRAATPKIANLKGIEYFTELTSLDCDGNSLTALDVSANKKLTVLICKSNLLPTLDIKANTLLTTLHCNSNQLQALDVRANKLLSKLDCGFNSLNALDVSENKSLTVLFCNDNQLPKLDVSLNSELNALKCDNNQLKALDIRATKIAEAGKLICSGQTSDGEKAQDIYLSVTEAQKTAGVVTTKPDVKTVNFPDVAFRTKLVNLGFTLNKAGTDIDETANKDKFTTSCTELDVSGLGITELTGIEKFTALTTLSCTSNDLTTLDVSKNTALTSLSFTDNKLKTLDISNNTKLITLSCERNLLETLTLNTALTELRCQYNKLTALTPINTLTLLYCANNQLTSLDVSGCSALTSLYCQNNRQLATLTLHSTSNATLTTLFCYNNQLTGLTLTNNTALDELHCFNNRMSTLNITKTALVAPDNLQCGLQTKDGTGVQTLTLTLTEAQFNVTALGTGTNNTGVTRQKETTPPTPSVP